MAFGMTEIYTGQIQAYTKAVYALREIPPHERRRLRELACVSQTRLARTLGMKVARIRALEGGANPAPDEAYVYWAALTAMTPEVKEEPLSTEEREKLGEYFDKGEICAHCRGIHARACPRVKRFAYHPDGALAEIEFWPDGKWPTDNVIFPDSPEMTE